MLFAFWRWPSFKSSLLYIVHSKYGYGWPKERLDWRLFVCIKSVCVTHHFDSINCYTGSQEDNYIRGLNKHCIITDSSNVCHTPCNVFKFVKRCCFPNAERNDFRKQGEFHNRKALILLIPVTADIVISNTPMLLKQSGIISADLLLVLILMWVDWIPSPLIYIILNTWNW